MRHWRPPAVDDAGTAGGRVTVPQVLQIEAVECGAASLAMVLARFGLWLPLEQVRVAAGVSRDGSKATSLLRAARGYGMVAKGYRKEVAELAAMPMPLILHWNFNHFLVLEGFGPDGAYLNDPASGSRRVAMDEFEAAYTGVVLSIRPGQDFRPSGNPPRPFAGLARRLDGSRGDLALIALLSVALVVPALAVPAFARIFIDGVVIGGQTRWLTPLVAMMLGAAVLRGALDLLQQRLLIRLKLRLSVGASARLIWHMLRLPMSFFTQRHAGDIAQRIGANDRVADLLSGGVASTLLDLATCVLIGLLMLAYDPLLGVVAVAFALPNILILRSVERRQDAASRLEVVESAKLHSASIGAIQSIETLKASGLEGQAFERWAGHQAKLLAIRREIGRTGAIVAAGPPLLQAVAAIAILGIGAARVMAGGMTIGTLVAFQALATMFALPIGRMVQLVATVRAARADLIRVDDALDHPLDPQFAGTTGRDVHLRGALEISALTFGYSPLDPPLIDGFALNVEPGMRVALVGGSGSGKSTLARLLAGQLTARSGDILLDGAPLAGMAPADRARRIATVDQDIFLFAGTVRDNLTLWDDGVDDARLIEALDDAAMLEDVLARPGGLDAPVEEGGANFSGGQRQRLEIARALAGDPAILVLDEATAALDPVTEQRIDARLRRRGATCIIVAHRLSTVRDADEIIVMRAGRIVERGPHDALVAQGGEYAALFLAH